MMAWSQEKEVLGRQVRPYFSTNATMSHCEALRHFLLASVTEDTQGIDGFVWKECGQHLGIQSGDHNNHPSVGMALAQRTGGNWRGGEDSEGSFSELWKFSEHTGPWLWLRTQGNLGKRYRETGRKELLPEAESCIATGSLLGRKVLGEVKGPS